MHHWNGTVLRKIEPNKEYRSRNARFFGLSIKVTDTDPDYIAIRIQASKGRFSGSARIYAGLNDLTEFATKIDGFPASPQDEPKYEFGDPDRKFAGGYCCLHFCCVDAVGHGKLDIYIEEEVDAGHRDWTAKFSLFPIEAAEIDRFATRLWELQHSHWAKQSLKLYPEFAAGDNRPPLGDIFNLLAVILPLHTIMTVFLVALRY